MGHNKYKNIWITFVEIKAEKGFDFIDLIACEQSQKYAKYKGAFANIIVKSSSFFEAVDILPKGLKEKHFRLISVESFDNAKSLIEEGAISKKLITEIDWLLESTFVFKICDDEMFCYV